MKKDLAWLRAVSSFMPSRVILAANNFRLFDHPQKAPKRLGHDTVLMTGKKAAGRA